MQEIFALKKAKYILEDYLDIMDLGISFKFHIFAAYPLYYYYASTSYRSYKA